MLKIGSHVSMSGKKMMLGSVEEALSYEANALMIYTGAPQNTRRKDVSELKITEAHELLSKNNIPLENVIVHAPYIINLGNTIKPETYQLGVDFLKEEIKRVTAIGAKYLVLHPGAHVRVGSEAGLKQIVQGLNEVLTPDQEVIICLETMAGKGTECGRTFEELAYIIENVELNEKLGVCLDTCHIHDAGYDLTNTDELIQHFDQIIGLEKLKVLHINDSKNEQGTHKDRHENIGYGKIGFEKLINIINHPKFAHIVKILETPYINEKTQAPYKEEIQMIKNNKFNDWIK